MTIEGFKHVRPGPPSARIRYPAALVLLLVLMSLTPVWCFDYLPMQDYPQHLFQAKLTAEALSGNALADSAYQVHLKPTYSVFYLLFWLLHRWCDVTNAGRAAVSVYFLLTGWACWRTLWFTDGEKPGWPALLMFPAASGPIYFLGFINFLYAMPVLWLIQLALLKHRGSQWTLRGFLRHLAALTALLFIHPFAILIQGLVVGAWLVISVRSAAQRRYFLLAFLACAAVAAGWMLSSFLSPAGAVGPSRMTFDSPWKNITFLFHLFSGLGGFTKPDGLTVILWSIVVVAIAWSAIRNRGQHSLNRLALFAAALLVLATVFGPFSASNVGYLNVRMTMTIYFLLTLWATQFRLDRMSLAALLAAVTFLQVRSIFVQYHIGREVAEIAPLVSAMDADATILPLVFDRDSPEADGYYFSLHLNDHFYYHIAKGGKSPYLWDAPSEGKTPLLFRAHAQPPSPDQYFPTQFRWETYGDAYRYFPVRGGSPSLYRYMEQHAVLRTTSGKWRLYERMPNPGR